MNEIINIKELLIFVAQKWKLSLVNFLIAFLVAVYYSFFVAEKQYKSTVTFFPPQSGSSIASIFSLGGIGGLSGEDVMPEQIDAIFSSSSLRKQIINKFNYYEKYELLESNNKFVKANKNLSKDLVLEATETGNLGMTKFISFSLTCYHTSPDTSYLLAKSVFSLIDSTINMISTTKGRTNRIFISEQLEKNINILDSITTEFNDFQKKYRVYNLPSQIQLSLSNYSVLNGQYMQNEIKIRTYSMNYKGDYAPIKSLKEENYILKKKMNNIISRKNVAVSIGLNNSVDMFKDIATYKREIEVQTMVVILLKKQLQEAKLKETKDISTLQVIDAPFVPEYKARPKRIFLLASIFSVYLFLWYFLLVGYFLFTRIIVKHPIYGETLNAFKKASN